VNVATGLETLEKSISFWEESLRLLKSRTADDSDHDENDANERTMLQLETILNAAYSLQRLSEELYLDEVKEKLIIKADYKSSKQCPRNKAVLPTL